MTGGGGGGGAGMRENRSRQDALQPVMIKQLLDASHKGPDDQYEVNGVSLQQVTLVARLSAVNMQVTMMAMKLDDGSGEMECVHMLPPDEDQSSREYALQKRQLLRDGAWARVSGASPRLAATARSRHIAPRRRRPQRDHIPPS